MKTIFITSFHSLISRNILQTKLLFLLGKDNKIILLVPDYKKEYFERNFSGTNITIEGIDIQPSRKEVFFRQFALALSSTKTLNIKKRVKFFEDKKIFHFLAAILPSFTIGRFQIFLKFFRLLDFVFVNYKKFEKLFDKYKPDLVFATDVMLESDVALLQSAKKRKIQTVAMIRSWDNLTSKGILRIFPDKLIVHNDLSKQEAIKYNNFPKNKISVIGIPHYDKYASGAINTKQEFFNRFNFDQNKKLILMAPVGNRYITNNNTDKFVVETLSELDVNILVRIPPGDFSNFDCFKTRGARVAFDYSGIHIWKGGRKTNEISREDDERLIDSLCFSDVVAAHLATMCIDAAFFNRPIIIIGFDPQKREYLSSIKRYFDYNHLKAIIKSGGVRIANSKEELLDLVNKYLKNPETDQKGRGVIVRLECQFQDAKSTERLYDVITSYL